MPIHEEEEWMNGMNDMIPSTERIDCDNPTVCDGDYNGNPDCFGCKIYHEAQEKKPYNVIRINKETKETYRYSLTDDNECLDCPHYIHGINYCLKNNCFWGSSNYLECHPIHDWANKKAKKCFGNFMDISKECKYRCWIRFPCYKEHERLMKELLEDVAKDAEEEAKHDQEINSTISYLQSTTQKIVNMRASFTKQKTIGSDIVLPNLEELAKELEDFLMEVGDIIQHHFPSEPPNMD